VGTPMRLVGGGGPDVQAFCVPNRTGRADSIASRADSIDCEGSGPMLTSGPLHRLLLVVLAAEVKTFTSHQRPTTDGLRRPRLRLPSARLAQAAQSAVDPRRRPGPPF
jgi:hypothetical protein